MGVWFQTSVITKVSEEVHKSVVIANDRIIDAADMLRGFIHKHELLQLYGHKLIGFPFNETTQLVETILTTHSVPFPQDISRSLPVKDECAFRDQQKLSGSTMDHIGPPTAS